MRDHIEQHRDGLGDPLLVVVTFNDDLDRLAAYRTHLGLDVPVVADVDRSLYRMLGAGRGSFREVWSVGTIAMYARLIWRGRRLRAPTDDTHQLGADVIVDRHGRIRRVWLPASPDRRPSIDVLDAALRDVVS